MVRQEMTSPQIGAKRSERTTPAKLTGSSQPPAARPSPTIIEFHESPAILDWLEDISPDDEGRWTSHVNKKGISRHLGHCGCKIWETARYRTSPRDRG